MWELMIWLTIKACSRLSRADPVIKLYIKGYFNTLGSRLCRMKPMPGLSMKAYRDLNSPGQSLCLSSTVIPVHTGCLCSYEQKNLYLSFFFGTRRTLSL